LYEMFFVNLQNLQNLQLPEYWSNVLFRSLTDVINNFIFSISVTNFITYTFASFFQIIEITDLTRLL